VQAPVVLEYRIDRDDRLVLVGGDWASFAIANDDPDLATPDPARSIWSHVADDGVRHLWQMLVTRARDEVPVVRVPFRCDAPAARRWFEMTLTAGADGQVDFRSELRREERRTPVAVLDRQASRDVALPMVRICSWCCRAHEDGRWMAIEEVVRIRDLLGLESSPRLTHGICDRCTETLVLEPDQA